MIRVRISTYTRPVGTIVLNDQGKFEYTGRAEQLANLFDEAQSICEARGKPTDKESVMKELPIIYHGVVWAKLLKSDEE